MDPAIWKVDLGHGIGPLELGVERSILLARLAELQIEVETDDEEPTWVYLPEIDTELTFGPDQPQRLLQIEVDDSWVRFGTLPVLGEPVHKIVDLLQVPPSETLWRPNNDPALRSPGHDAPVESATDEQLLDSGTLWITTLGLGLNLWRGDVDALFLRQPQDSPRKGVGQFSPQHAELSRNGSLRQQRETPTSGEPPPKSWYQTLYRIGFFALVLLVGWRAVVYQQRWNTAATTEGTIVAVRPPAPDPFPVEFTVAYQDQQGKPHQAVFDLADVNTGRKVGDKVDVRYLADEPDVAMGLASSRDAIIIMFLPWVIGIVVAFVLLPFVPLVAGLLISQLRKEKSSPRSD